MNRPPELRGHTGHAEQDSCLPNTPRIGPRLLISCLRRGLPRGTSRASDTLQDIRGRFDEAPANPPVRERGVADVPLRPRARRVIVGVRQLVVPGPVRGRGQWSWPGMNGAWCTRHHMSVWWWLPRRARLSLKWISCVFCWFMVRSLSLVKPGWCFFGLCFVLAVSQVHGRKRASVCRVVHSGARCTVRRLRGLAGRIQKFHSVLLAETMLSYPV